MYWIFTEWFLCAKPVLGAGAKTWTKQTKAFLHSISSQCIHSSGQEEANNKQFSSAAQSCQTLCDSMNRSMPGLPVYHQLLWSLPKLMSIESVMPTNHLILCHPLLFPPSIFPSMRVFSKESALSIRWPKYWCLSFNNSPPKEHPGLIAFRMDWLDLLALQGTLKSLLQRVFTTFQKHQILCAQLSL